MYWAGSSDEACLRLAEQMNESPSVSASKLQEIDSQSTVYTTCVQSKVLLDTLGV